MRLASSATAGRWFHQGPDPGGGAGVVGFGRRYAPHAEEVGTGP